MEAAVEDVQAEDADNVLGGLKHPFTNSAKIGVFRSEGWARSACGLRIMSSKKTETQ